MERVFKGNIYILFFKEMLLLFLIFLKGNVLYIIIYFNNVEKN